MIRQDTSRQFMFVYGILMGRDSYSDFTLRGYKRDRLYLGRIAYDAIYPEEGATAKGHIFELSNPHYQLQYFDTIENGLYDRIQINHPSIENAIIWFYTPIQQFVDSYDESRKTYEINMSKGGCQDVPAENRKKYPERYEDSGMVFY